VALAYGAQAYWLSRNLAEALAATDPPPDILAQQCREL
jgi:hypothetical protein